MTPLATTLLAGNLICDATGQILFKAVAMRSNSESKHYLVSIMRNGWTWVGLMAYVGEFILWVAFLSLEPLGKATLLSTINILLVMLAGRLFFAESLTLKRMLAAGLIMGGVILVGLD